MSSPTSRRRRDAGFTLFELMMATMVLAFGIATSITALNSGFRAMDTARNTTIAGQLLQSSLEDLRLLPWSGLTALQGNATVTFNSQFTNGNLTAAAIVNRFNVTRNVYPYPVGTPSASATMMQIDMTATWQGVDGRQHALTYSTFYGKNGLHDYFVQ